MIIDNYYNYEILHLDKKKEREREREKKSYVILSGALWVLTSYYNYHHHH